MFAMFMFLATTLSSTPSTPTAEEITVNVGGKEVPLQMYCDRFFGYTPAATAACVRIHQQERLVEGKMDAPHAACAAAREQWRDLNGRLAELRLELSVLPKSPSAIPELAAENAARAEHLEQQLAVVQVDMTSALAKAKEAGEELVVLRREADSLRSQLDVLEREKLEAGRRQKIAACVGEGGDYEHCSARYPLSLPRPNLGPGSVGDLGAVLPGAQTYPEEFKGCYP
jgi:hypothetical protein